MEWRDDTPNPWRTDQISTKMYLYIVLRPCQNALGDLQNRGLGLTQHLRHQFWISVPEDRCLGTVAFLLPKSRSCLVDDHKRVLSVPIGPVTSGLLVNRESFDWSTKSGLLIRASSSGRLA